MGDILQFLAANPNIAFAVVIARTCDCAGDTSSCDHPGKRSFFRAS